jgi:hypothetical protein
MSSSAPCSGKPAIRRGRRRAYTAGGGHRCLGLKISFLSCGGGGGEDEIWLRLRQDGELLRGLRQRRLSGAAASTHYRVSPMP